MLDLIARAVNYMDNFEIIQGVTPFTSPRFMTISIVLFLSSLYVLAKYMQNKPAYSLKKFSVFHNFLCSLISGVTGCGMIWGLFRIHKSPLHPNHWYLANLCAPRGTKLKGAVYFWTWFYHAQKYYDLIDTYLIILRKSKKGLSFLHVYHHAIMLMLTNECFQMGFCAIWLPTFLNCVVHVVMYYYYALVSLGKRWKRRHYITILQLVQFSIIASYFVWFLPGRFFFNINCSGNLPMCVTSVCVDLYFFYLFYFFYKESFGKKKDKKDSEPAVLCTPNVRHPSIGDGNVTLSQHITNMAHNIPRAHAISDLGAHSPSPTLEASEEINAALADTELRSASSYARDTPGKVSHHSESTKND